MSEQSIDKAFELVPLVPMGTAMPFITLLLSLKDFDAVGLLTVLDARQTSSTYDQEEGIKISTWCRSAKAFITFSVVSMAHYQETRLIVERWHGWRRYGNRMVTMLEVNSIEIDFCASEAEDLIIACIDKVNVK